MRKLLLFLAFVIFCGCAGCIRKRAQEEQFVCGNVVSERVRVERMENAPGYFKAKCSTCHQFEMNATGPALQGMMKRVPSRRWLMSYLKNEDSLIRSGDTTALRISEKTQTGPCHHFSDLNDHYLDELIRFTEQ
jgi:hypothetical protein